MDPAERERILRVGAAAGRTLRAIGNDLGITRQGMLQLLIVRGLAAQRSAAALAAKALVPRPSPRQRAERVCRLCPAVFRTWGNRRYCSDCKRQRIYASILRWQKAHPQRVAAYNRRYRARRAAAKAALTTER